MLPPIRDRRCEIPILLREFLIRAAARAGRAVPELSPAAMAALLRHDWPGNVRELKHEAERLVATVLCDRIELDDLPPRLAANMGPPAAEPIFTAPVAPTGPEPAPIRRLADEVEELERTRIIEALAATGGVKTHAAQMLGMPIRTFTFKLKNLRLP